MTSQLTTSIEQLKETTAAKERIESELKVAHNIQMGILPKLKPPFSDHQRFDLFATLLPAKEVGGDLYDFFFIDEDHLCLVIGDVSGKGVPAALFMAMVKTLIKGKASKGMRTNQVLMRVNEDLVPDNRLSMFVTLFFAILNIRNGEIEFCNGGHNPPYIIRSDGRSKRLEIISNLPLGLDSHFNYRSENLLLRKNEILFLYTDGITDAINDKNQLYSEATLEDTLKKLDYASLETAASRLIDKVQNFAKDMPQFDDITLLMLKAK